MTALWGLTGGIACGKSTVSRLLEQQGATIIDADVLAREVVAPGSDALREIAGVFGSDVLTPEGTLDRKVLGAAVFGDEGKRRALNAITHPRIAALAALRTQEAMARGDRVVIYDAPLLMENNLHHGMEQVLVVAASEETQLRRLKERDGLDAAAARARMASQMPLEQKRKHATHVFENDGTLEQLETQVRTFWQAHAPR